uniref:PWWP domain-containing protein n=1 Tax=Magallana gigas TaxID=29159 RepID=A0A8W8MIH0_MAGGI
MLLFQLISCPWFLISFLVPCYGSLQLGFSKLQRGHRLDRKLIQSFPELSFLDCVIECLVTPRCKSVNYFKGANFCEINYENKTTAETRYMESAGWVYSEKEHWPKELAGACSNSTCGINQTCKHKKYSEDKFFECVLSDCGIPDQNGIDLNTTRREDAIGIHRRIHASCFDGYSQSGSEWLICQSNGEWKYDIVCTGATAEQKLSLIMETRRKRKEVESQKTELHKLVTYVKGQIVFCKWKHGIWWPGFVEEVFGEDVYKISFWEEDEINACFEKKASPRHLKEKYLQDLKQAKSIQNSNSLDTSPAKISVVDALKLIDADCVSEENYTTRSRVEEVFPEIVDSVEEVVSDDGSKNLSGYSEHSRNCSNTAKDKEKAERGEHGSLDTSPAEINVEDALKLIDADCVSEENNATQRFSRVEEVFPEIVDSVEEVVSDDGSKNLSGYSEHSRNCSNTAKDKEKAERGEHGSCLSRKKNTLECFLEDLKWAKESHDTSKCQVRVSRKRKKQKGCKEQCSRQKKKRRKFIKIQEVQGSGDVDCPHLQPKDHSCMEIQAGLGDVDYPQLQPDDHSCSECQEGPGDVDYPQLQPTDHSCLELQPDDHSCSERQVGSGDIDYPEDCEDLDDPDFIVETEDEETKDESDRESSILDDKSSSNLMNDVVVESYQGDVGYPELQPVDHSCTELQAVPSDVDYPQLQPDDHNSSELQAGPGDVDYPQLQPDDHSCAELQAGAGDIDNPQLQPTDHSCLKLQAGPGDVDYPQLQPDDHSCAELQAGPGDIDNPQLQPTDHSFLELQAGPGEVDNPQLQPDDHSCPQGLASSDDVDYPEDCEDLNDPDYIVETEDESDSESSILDDESSSNLMNDVEVESCMGDVDYPQLQPDDHSCPELQAGPDDVDSPKPEDCEALDERDLDCDNPPCKRKLDEKDCLFDKKFPNVFIKGLKKDNAKSKHNRVYDCVHACLYCHELFTNIQSHLERRHVNHTKVKAIKELKDQKMKETNQEKIDKLEKRLNSEMKLLRNLGDHHHNMKVLRHKEGELLLPRRRLVTFNFEEYGPCPKCKEWMVLNSSISNHQKTCPVKSTDYHKGSTIIQIGILTGKVKTTGSKRIEKEVLPSMKRDKFAEICMNDPLILALGDVWFMKNIDNKRKRKNYSSFHMRLAARLLLAFRNLVKRMDVSMSEMLSPENFDNVAEVALQICNSTEHEEDELQHPSTAIKSGFDLMRMASSKVGISIKTKNKEMKKEGEAFMYLMSKEWGYKVNKVARSTLSERMFNQKKELPYPEDIMKLSSYLVENLEFVDLSYTAVSGMMFRRIVMLVEARLILYNRRRPGELEALSLQCYRNRSKEVSATDLSLREQLSKFEKEMLDNQELVEIRGKNGTRVPVICPKEVIPAMNYLASKEIRKKAGIRDGNPFLFANTAEDVVRAGLALEELRTECRSLKFPDRIYATNLRKYCATIAQVIGLKDHELKYLCRHMGHTMEVHELHYRSTSGLIERLEIAKLMVMQECNVVGKFHGKSLKDITFEDILDKEDISPTQGEATRGEETPSVEDTSLSLDDMEEDVLVSRRKPKKSVRKAWTKEEEEEMKKYFKTYYDGTTKKTCPSRAECQRAIELSKNNGGYIHLRSWETIKKKVNNFLFSSVKKK